MITIPPSRIWVKDDIKVSDDNLLELSAIRDKLNTAVVVENSKMLADLIEYMRVRKCATISSADWLIAYELFTQFNIFGSPNLKFNFGNNLEFLAVATHMDQKNNVIQTEKSDIIYSGIFQPNRLVSTLKYLEDGGCFIAQLVQGTITNLSVSCVLLIANMFRDCIITQSSVSGQLFIVCRLFYGCSASIYSKINDAIESSQPTNSILQISSTHNVNQIQAILMNIDSITNWKPSQYLYNVFVSRYTGNDVALLSGPKSKLKTVVPVAISIKREFPLVSTFLNKDVLFERLRAFSRGSQGTFTIFDHQGLQHDRLRQLFTARHWMEHDMKDIKKYLKKLTDADKRDVQKLPFSDVAWLDVADYKTFKNDPDIYNIRTILQNIIAGDGIHGTTTDKNVVTNKAEMYKNIMKHNPEIGGRYLPKTWNLKEFKPETIEQGNVFIVKPVGTGAGGGTDISVITSVDQFAKAKKELLASKYKDAIISEYIVRPHLVNGRKFHIRMYFMVCLGHNNEFTWHMWDRGKIVTAELDYKEEDYMNPKIHDSHFKSTPVNLYYPEDLKIPKSSNTDDILTQMREILHVAAEVIQPHVKPRPESVYGFEVFGVDFMLTDKLDVKLIEINARHDYGHPTGDEKRFGEYSAAFHEWMYSNSILRIFPEGEPLSSRYVRYGAYTLDRERDELGKFIQELASNDKNFNQFNGKHTAIYVPMSDFHKIDILVDYYTENSRIHVRKDAKDISLYDHFYKRDLLSRAEARMKTTDTTNKALESGYDEDALRKRGFSEKELKVAMNTAVLRDTFYEFREIYNASAESTLFYLSMLHVIFGQKCGENLKILDGAGGYGTRLLTAITLNAEYRGVEPNSLSTPGFTQMVADLGTVGRQIMFEDGLPYAPAILELPLGWADCIMFSPPLYDGEIYTTAEEDANNEKQSTSLFRDFDTWKTQFLHTSLQILWDRLAPGGYAIFQSMRYDYIHEFMLTQPDAEYRGVISRMTYARQTRYKPNWIWQKRHSEKVPGKKQPKGKGKIQPLSSEAQTHEFDITIDSNGIAEQSFNVVGEILQPNSKGKKQKTMQPLDEEPLTSKAQTQELDIAIDSNGVAEQSFGAVAEIVLPKTKAKGKKQNTIEEVGLIDLPKANKDNGPVQEFDIIMDSNDILEQPTVVGVVKEVNPPKVKKPRSKKNTTVASVLPDEEKVHIKKMEAKKQALSPEAAQEFDIVLESSPQEIDIAKTPILPSPSEYKQISIKLPSQPRHNKPKAEKQLKKQPTTGDEEVGLIEPIKPKRVYTQKQPVEKQKGDDS